MAESPPHVEVSTTGVKIDYGDRVVRSAKTPLPAAAPRVVDEPAAEDPDD